MFSALGAPIIGGGPSPEEPDAVVLLTYNGYEGTCTGAVVSPTLILTARHCFFELLDSDRPRLCGDRGAGRPVLRARPLEGFAIFQGHEKPLSELPVRPFRLHSSTNLDTCDNDTALLEVDTPVNIEPLALRLDTPPMVGEVGTLVGWGATLANAEVRRDETWRLPDSRQQREITIEALGGTNYTPEGGYSRDIEPAAFVGSEGACYGDSGGPLLSNTTGAIIGVQYVIESASIEPVAPQSVVDPCLGGLSYFQRLDLQEEWIRTAFRDAGSALWLEGRPKPAALGGVCETPDDCVSGLCASAGTSTFCSRPCDGEPCPSGFECTGTDLGAQLCSPVDIEGPPSLPAESCTFAARPDPSGWRSFALSMLISTLLRGRRWRVFRRPRCEPDSSA